MKPRNAVHVSGESRRTSGEFGIGGNIVVPRNIDRAQDLEGPYRLEASRQYCVGRQRWRGRAAQIAVIAGMGRRERPGGGCLFGRRGGFAMTDDRERVDDRARGERCKRGP